MPQLDSLWIDLNATSDNLFLNEHYRSYNAFRQIRFPDEQDPQMIMLIGAEQKARAIQRLEPSLKIQGTHEKIHLLLAPDNAKARSPVLLADCELHNTLFLSRVLDTPGVEHHPLLWHQKSLTESLGVHSPAYLVYTKLLCPFSTLVCFFADDLGGTRAVANLLASWITSSTYRSSDLPVSTYPRVLIFKAHDNNSSSEEKATIDFMEVLEEETHARTERWGREFDALLKQHFGGLRVLALPNEAATQSQIPEMDDLWKSLRIRVIRGSQRIHDRRRKAQVAFSATHFKAFFHLATKHFSKTISIPFSFMKASRLANPVPQDFSTHINNFLTDIELPLVESFGIPFIASAMTLDSYPPGMHSKYL
jgi:hypothetical protein